MREVGVREGGRCAEVGVTARRRQDTWIGSTDKPNTVRTGRQHRTRPRWEGGELPAVDGLMRRMKSFVEEGIVGLHILDLLRRWAAWAPKGVRRKRRCIFWRE